MRAFIINLDSATARWAFVERSFQVSRLELCRVPAIWVNELQFPHPDFSARSYRWLHGRANNPREAACYFSHLKAMRMFLATGESHAFIGEDDITLRPDFDQAVAAAMDCSSAWNILRLTGLSSRGSVKVSGLVGSYSLCFNFGRIKGSGGYLLDRQAAERLLAGLLPMRLPFDHAFDREWFFGLRAATIHPFPCSQVESEFLSSVQPGTYPKLSRTHRFLATYPYQLFNEIARFWFRGAQYVRAKIMLGWLRG
jgi:glycosyl transferase family 25